MASYFKSVILETFQVRGAPLMSLQQIANKLHIIPNRDAWPPKEQLEEAVPFSFPVGQYP